MIPSRERIWVALSTFLRRKRWIIYPGGVGLGNLLKDF